MRHVLSAFSGFFASHAGICTVQRSSSRAFPRAGLRRHQCGCDPCRADAAAGRDTHTHTLHQVTPSKCSLALLSLFWLFSPQRDNVVNSFRSGKIWVLICTALLARGIDFKGVNLVLNYDFPTSSVEYIHRIGEHRQWFSGFLNPEKAPDNKSVVWTFAHICLPSRS